jgi:hypothetical protein
MSSPSFLNTDFAYQQLLGVTDVQSIMDAISTMVTTTLTTATTGVFTTTQRWSNPGVNVYQSPSDARGRYMKLTLARTSAVRMGFKVEDPSGTLVDGEINVAVAGSTVNLFAGPGHLYVEANNAGTWEAARAFISDPTPEALDVSSIYVWGLTHRNTAQQVIGNNTVPDYWTGRNLDGTALGTASAFLIGARTGLPISDNSNGRYQTEAGSDCASAMCIAPLNGAQTVRQNAGKLYQLASVGMYHAPSVILQIPVDTGLVGKFQVLNMATAGMNRLALRRT